MPAVTADVIIRRPPGEVFAFVSDPTNDPLWWDGVREVRLVAGRAGAVGAEYEQLTRLFGHTFVARVRLSAHEPPHRTVLTSVHSATPFTAEYRCVPAGGGTRFQMVATVRVEGWYRLFGPLFLPLLRSRTRRHFARLARVMEG